MAGRITYRNGKHPSRVGSWSEGVTLDERSRAEIANLIGRKLTVAEIDDLEEWLAVMRDMASGADVIHVRDKVATLDAMSREDDQGLLTALANCDEWTRAAITGKVHKLYRGLGFDPWRFELFMPDQLRAAVLLTRWHCPKDTAGRPKKRMNFAPGFIKFWRAWTGEEPRTSSHDTYGNSPDVECAQILAEAIGDVVDASAMAKSLRRARNRLRQISA